MGYFKECNCPDNFYKFLWQVPLGKVIQYHCLFLPANSLADTVMYEDASGLGDQNEGILNNVPGLI